MAETTEEDIERKKRSDAVGVGMAIAAGIVMSAYGDDTVAGEILNAAGLTTVAEMRAIGVETYDIRLCAPVLHSFRERDRARKFRAALTQPGTAQ